MRFIYFLLLIFFVTNSSYSQIDSLFEFQEIYEIDSERGYGATLFRYNEDVYAMSTKDKRKFTLLNLTENTETAIAIPDSIEYYDAETFCMAHDSIFFLDWQYFHGANLKSGKHVLATIFDGCAFHMKAINDQVYIFGVKFCGDMSHNRQTTMSAIDLTERKRFFTVFPNPSAFGFAFFFPSKVMDIDTNEVYIADFDKYRIRIYDHDANSKSLIEHSPAEWVSEGSEIPRYPVGTHQMANFIHKIRPYTRNRSLIKNINLIGDNKLLIAWTIPTGEELETIMRYDLWEKQDSSWTLKTANLRDFEEDDNSIMTKYSVPIKYLYRVVDDYLLIKYEGVTKELFEKYQGKTCKEFKDACDNYFLDNDLKSIVLVYKLK